MYEVVLGRRFDRGKALGFDLGARLGRGARVLKTSQAGGNVTLRPPCWRENTRQVGRSRVGKFPVDQAKAKKNKQKWYSRWVSKQLSTHNPEGDVLLVGITITKRQAAVYFSFFACGPVRAASVELVNIFSILFYRAVETGDRCRWAII